MVAALALCFPAPVLAQQEPPPSLWESAPAQDPGTATPSDGGRSVPLLVAALVAMAGAGVLVGDGDARAGAGDLRGRRGGPEPASAAGLGGARGSAEASASARLGRR